MPPIKIYETQNTTESYLLKDKEMVKLPRDQHDFLKKGSGAGNENDTLSESRKEQSVMNASTKSPFKSLHIKGKNEVIKESLDEDNFAGVQVVDFGIKESN